MTLSLIRDSVSPLAIRLLQEADLLDLAEKLSIEDVLSSADILALQTVPLPVLNIFSAIRIQQRTTAAAPLVPILTLPLAEIRQTQGLDACLKKAQGIVDEHLYDKHPRIRLAMNSWMLNKSPEDFLDLLAVFIEKFSFIDAEILGPSLDCLFSDTKDSRRIERYLQQLRLLGITHLRTKVNFPFTHLLRGQGFSIHFEHALKTSPRGKPRYHTPTNAEDLAGALSQLGSAKDVFSWTLSPRMQVSDFGADAPLRFDILRSSILLSLMLPAATRILVPSNLLGDSLLSVFLKQGGDGFGYICLQSEKFEYGALEDLAIVGFGDRQMQAYCNFDQMTHPLELQANE